MRHVNLDSEWKFTKEPFPAFRCSLVYGRNKRAFNFLPVKGVLPVTEYTVTPMWEEDKVLYHGISKEDAEAAKAKYDEEQIKISENPRMFHKTAKIQTTLPEMIRDTFRIIKTKAKGTIMVVPGSDKTDRCLLFVGAKGGFRGDVFVFQKETTCNVLVECFAGNACDSSFHVIALLEKGESIAFHSVGRRTNHVYVYTWNGKEVNKRTLAYKEWESEQEMSCSPDEEEIL